MEICDLLSSIDNELYRIKAECCTIPITHTLGKKLRSQFLIAMYRSILGQYPQKSDFEKVCNACVAVELIHDSSLIVDDIFDKGKLRRNRPTLHTEIGQNEALLIANILLMRAGKIVSSTFHPLGNLSLIDDFFETATALASGELEQQRQITLQRVNPATIMREYEQSVEGKSSSLFILAGILGVLAAKDGATSFVKALGSRLGIAFQMKDDFMDLYATEQELQKDNQNDLFMQKITFPTAYVIEKESLCTYAPEYFKSFDFSKIKDELQAVYHERCKELYNVILSAPTQFDKKVITSVIEKILAVRFQTP